MAIFEVSTLSRGAWDGATEAETFFLSGSNRWIIFAVTATVDNVYQGVDPFGVALSEVIDNFGAAGVTIEDNGDLPANAVLTEVALHLPGPLGSVFKSPEIGDFVRVVTAPTNRGAPATEFRIHPDTDVPEGLIADTTPILVIPTNTAGQPWTRANLFQDMFGLYSQVTSGLGENAVAIGNIQVRVTFTQTPPTIATATARAVLGDSATMQASVNPQGATTAFPVTVYFTYGVDSSDESTWLVTPESIPVVGSDTVFVGVNRGNLLGNTTYFYRAHAIYPDGVVDATNVVSFSTIETNKILQVF
jgi:hypothetical protein